MMLQRNLGSEQEAVSVQRCVEIELALASYAPSIKGAIYTPGECAADCQKICDGLMALRRQRGVHFLLDTPIEKITMSGSRVLAIATSQGHTEADQYVMALGTASAPMARALGVNFPIYPLNYYSITVDVHETPDGSCPTAPWVSVTDSARKVVFARIGLLLWVGAWLSWRFATRKLTPAKLLHSKPQRKHSFRTAVHLLN